MDKGRITIADEQADFCRKLQAGLTKYNFSIASIVTHGHDLQQSIELHKPEIVLFNTEISGKAEALCQLESTKHMVDTPSLIFMTSKPKDDDLIALTGFRDAVILPRLCHISELAANIIIALERRRSGLPAFKDMLKDIDKMKCDDFQYRLGRLIRSARRELLLTQATAAERLNINYRYYQDIESGKKNIKISTLFKIINGLVKD